MTGGENASARRGRFWAVAPLVLIGTMLLGLGLMVAIATDDPSFSVEPDYYERALDWDGHLAELRQNALLGWRLTPELRRSAAGVELIAELTDRRGTPLSGARLEVSTFHLARGDEPLTVALTETEAGRYRAPLPPRLRPGIWELRFTARRGEERFTQVSRAELRGGDRP